MTPTRGLSVEESLVRQLKKYIAVSRGVIKEAAPASVLRDADRVLHALIDVVCEVPVDSISTYIAILELAVVSMDAMVTMVEAELKLQHPERNN